MGVIYRIHCTRIIPSTYHHEIERKRFPRYWPFVRGINSPDTDELPSQRPVTRSFGVFFDRCLNKRLSKESWGWWFVTSSGSLWCHCNDIIVTGFIVWLLQCQSIYTKQLKTTTPKYRVYNICSRKSHDKMTPIAETTFQIHFHEWHFMNCE